MPVCDSGAVVCSSSLLCGSHLGRCQAEIPLIALFSFPEPALPTGSFYIHCDPTASHYIKILLDAIFLPEGGEFKNEIVWHYRRWTGLAKKFQELHDIIFFYVKSSDYNFNVLYTAY